MRMLPARQRWLVAAACLPLMGTVPGRTCGSLDAATPDLIMGTIVDPAGKPVAGADVVGVVDQSDEGFGPDSEPSLRASTDAGGRFRLDWSDRLAHPGARLP